MSDDYFNWQEDLPFDAQQRREVFARFGLAIHNAQCLEQQLGIMLAAMYNQEFLEVSPEDRNAFYDRELSKTLGQMAKDLGNKASLSPTLADRLQEAVKIRNWLAHSYFYQRSRAICTLKGCEEMILEPQDKADFFRKLDIEFTDIMYKWLDHFGISKKNIETYKEKFLRGEILD